jgi:hypothetical protein
MQHMAGCVKLAGPKGGNLHKRRIAGECIIAIIWLLWE